MRNYFTVTISDVHGSRHYSFKHFFRKFAWVILGVFALIWTVGAFSLWWLANQANELEARNQATIEHYNVTLSKTRADYESLLTEKSVLEDDLEQKNAQLEFLDQSLQGLETLVGIDSEEPENLPYDERVKRVQLNTLGKNIMLSITPNGHPVAEYKGITSKYGYRKHPLTQKKHMHGGIDYRSRTGDEVIATADGIVQYSSYSEESGFGNLVTILHANGFKTRYGHLSQRSVKVGQMVQKGQKIGETGTTGRSSGPHLHYEIWFLHHRLNPLPFDKWKLETYDELFDKVKGVPWASLTRSVDTTVKKVEKQLSRKVALSAVK
ncbi:M23 family metallopeptidase [Thiomicrorhabdus sediminis]|uniref:M23 family peptidase n=1 Tax=Thiomicrorhabdus sediminis TaxID=2580412 RepID=A0A4P9K473_9GAMM|nr:M23 family metallopeptidase [Thiomicrorhabdus sediminis]QCU89744.1 M23 family peptidase [Thiomicrorhabdus sediminis]